MSQLIKCIHCSKTYEPYKTRKRNCMKKIPRKNPLTKGKMTRRNIKNFMKGCTGK